MMRNKILLTIWVLAFLCQFFVGSAIVYTSYIAGGVCIILYFAIPVYMMTSDSRLFKTIYGKGLLAGAALFIVGLLFEIQHWYGANIILRIAVAALLMTYLVRFIYKKKKGLLDWLKVVWFELELAFAFISVEHLSETIQYNSEKINLALNILFVVMFGYFICLKNRNRTLFLRK